MDSARNMTWGSWLVRAGTGWYERPSHPVPNMTYGTGIEVSGSEKKHPAAEKETTVRVV